jgi:peptidoglycan/xylan/chitin deacetylase (PgdA/CDA1 family)
MWLLLSSLLLVSWSAAALAKSLSLTFDDGLNPAKHANAARLNEQLIAGLRAERVTSMIFPSLSHIGGEPGLELIRAWSAAGHSVGNHTASHMSLSSPKMTLGDFAADVAKADAVFRTVPRFVPMLRFPFLKEGDSIEKRDGIRAWMSANGYKPAEVSIDTSDWYYNQQFVAFTDAGLPDKAAQVQAAFVEHLLDRASYYDNLAKRVLGRSPAHVMLLHTSAINAATITTVIRAFRAHGWKIVSPPEAFRDPMYAMRPNIVPAGESIVWALAREKGIDGLRYPGEDSVYEEPRLKSLGLVARPEGG